MPKKATSADAEIILKLYDLRREAEMRKARNWWTTEFWPGSVEDYMKVSSDTGSQHNNWLRQVPGYWSMAAALALRGAVNQDLFLEPSFSGEMFLIFAKVRPFLDDLRARTKNPRVFANIEKLIKSKRESREFLAYMETNVGNRRKAMAEKTAGTPSTR